MRCPNCGYDFDEDFIDDENYEDEESWEFPDSRPVVPILNGTIDECWMQCVKTRTREHWSLMHEKLVQLHVAFKRNGDLNVMTDEAKDCLYTAINQAHENITDWKVN